MTKADITAAVVKDFGFSKVPPAIAVRGVHWFARPSDDDIVHYVCIEYQPNARVYGVLFGVESKSVRDAAFALIDQICVDLGTPLVSHSILAKWPCLTMFRSNELATDVPATITRSDFGMKVMHPLDLEVFRKVDTLAAVCSTLLRTDGGFEWMQSAPGFRVVYAAVLVNRLGLDSAVFWKSVATLQESFLSQHLAVKLTGLKGSEFLARIAETLGLGSRP